jgi:molybdopterin-biosynthesis enzyme MoeA-like protein
MAWPMLEWVLDTHYSGYFRKNRWLEKSVIVMGAMEASLTPLMESIEREFDAKVFSLPSVDHAVYGRHIELGVKGSPEMVERAFGALKRGLQNFAVELGPELVRS